LAIKTQVSHKSATAASASQVRKEWHAVSILPKGACCEAALAIRTTRFLSAQAPRLPLAQCTTPKSCTCAYKHHADRRGQPRRKDEAIGLKRATKVEQERRARGDRRKTD
jgi:hypothetical protein